MLQHYLNQFNGKGAHSSEQWTQHQTLALQHFLEKGFPTPKDESWRSIARSVFLKQPFTVNETFNAEIEAIAQSLPESKTPTVRFICVNGLCYLPPSESLPQGLEIKPILHVMQEDAERLFEYEPASMELGHGFNALNTLFSEQGVSIVVQEDCVIEPTLELWYVSKLPIDRKEPSMFCMRNNLVVGTNSKLKVIEHTLTLEDHELSPIVCTNTLTTMTLASHAEVNWAQSVALSDRQSYIGQLVVKQYENSTFHAESLVLGGGLVRNTLSVDLCGSQATCELRGLTQVKKQHQVDHQIWVDHKADHTQSDMHYRSIADEKGKASFGGEVRAQQGIHKMISHQGNYNLLLSDDAEMITRPRLALWADDIECTHGATVGALDQKALFYLESRGLSKEAARLMLIQAFSAESLELMKLLASNSDRLASAVKTFMQKELS